MQSFDETHELPEEALIKAAEVIRDRGLAGTSMNAIADAVGITKGGLYYYLKGKQDLLYQIMRHGMEMTEGWTREVESIQDPRERLRVLVQKHISAIAYGKAPTVVTEEVQALKEADRRDILLRKRRYFDFIRGILEEMESEGDLRAADYAVATFNVLGMILHFARWWRPDGRLTPVAVADEIVDLALTGLERREARSPSESVANERLKGSADGTSGPRV